MILRGGLGRDHRDAGSNSHLVPYLPVTPTSVIQLVHHYSAHETWKNILFVRFVILATVKRRSGQRNVVVDDFEVAAGEAVVVGLALSLNVLAKDVDCGKGKVQFEFGAALIREQTCVRSSAENDLTSNTSG